MQPHTHTPHTHTHTHTHTYIHTFTQCFIFTRPPVKHFSHIISFNPHGSLWSRYSSSLHFAHEETDPGKLSCGCLALRPMVFPFTPACRWSQHALFLQEFHQMHSNWLIAVVCTSSGPHPAPPSSLLPGMEPRAFRLAGLGCLYSPSILQKAST